MKDKKLRELLGFEEESKLMVTENKLTRLDKTENDLKELKKEVEELKKLLGFKKHPLYWINGEYYSPYPDLEINDKIEQLAKIMGYEYQPKTTEPAKYVKIRRKK